MVGDYICGVVGVERKSDDFLDFDRVVMQAKELKANFGDKAYLIVECNLDELVEKSKEHFHQDMTNSILGMVASLAARVGIVPLFLSNEKYMAYVMKGIFEKGNDGKKVENIKPIRPRETKHDREVHVICGYQNIDHILAERLLNHFGSIQAIVMATKEQLMEVEGIGDIKAQQIFEVSRCKYNNKVDIATLDIFN
jgi:Fanconi anemia group M protein